MKIYKEESIHNINYAVKKLNRAEYIVHNQLWDSKKNVYMEYLIYRMSHTRDIKNTDMDGLFLSNLG